MSFGIRFRSATKPRHGLAPCAVLVALALATPTRGQDSEIDGWTITRLGGAPGQEVCTATFASPGPAELSVTTQGPLLWLMISSPALRADVSGAVMTLRTPSLGELTRVARVHGPVYGVALDDEVDAYLLDPGPLVVGLQPHDFTYALRNAAAAIDEVRRCAGQPTRAEAKARPRPQRLPGGWELAEVGGACSARLPGDAIDVLVSVNDADEVILMAGHHDWSVWSGPRTVQIRFDDAPARSLTGLGFANLVFVPLPDAADVAALRKAKELTWTLPFGTYAVRVDDVGAALDAAAGCTRSKREAPPLGGSRPSPGSGP